MHGHKPRLSAVLALHWVYYLFLKFCQWPDPNFHSAKLWSGLWITQHVMFICKSCWNINTRKMLWILFSLLCVKYIFFWFYRSIGFEGNIKYAKKNITSAMECSAVAAFTFATRQIRSCLLWVLFAIFQVFLAVLGNWSEFFGCFIKARRFEEKLSICWGKQELARTCSVCVNARGKKHNRSKISFG